MTDFCQQGPSQRGCEAVGQHERSEPHHRGGRRARHQRHQAFFGGQVVEEDKATDPFHTSYVVISSLQSWDPYGWISMEKKNCMNGLQIKLDSCYFA